MINNVTLMGRLTANPRLNTTTSGKSVANFTIALDKFRREDGADFIDCVAWEKTAEFINRYFGKGNMIAVTGSLQTRKYEDRDGNNRTAFEVVVRDASFCGEKREDAAPGADTATGTGTAAEKAETFDILDEDDEDLPF